MRRDGLCDGAKTTNYHPWSKVTMNRGHTIYQNSQQGHQIGQEETLEKRTMMVVRHNSPVTSGDKQRKRDRNYWCI
ncbi:hypothetical protein ACOSQ2_008101 [Xanthoceras sorbifolium]